MTRTYHLHTLVVVANDNKYVFIIRRAFHKPQSMSVTIGSTYFHYTRPTSTLNPEHGSGLR